MSDNLQQTQTKPLGMQITALRKARGWTLAELAARIGTSAPTLHRYENGWDRFELATLRKIASALGARLDVNLSSESISGHRRPRLSAKRFVGMLGDLFWDKELESSDLSQYQGWVLERVLMYGDRSQMDAARQYFGDGLIRKAIERRAVDERTRNFWRTMLCGDNDAP